MICRTRDEAEREATRLSAMGEPDVWLVVDTGDVSARLRATYRVWRESTIIEQQRRGTYLFPNYELLSRAVNGQLERIV